MPCQRLTQSFDLPRASRASNSSPPVTLVVKLVATSCDLGLTVPVCNLPANSSYIQAENGKPSFRQTIFQFFGWSVRPRLTQWESTRIGHLGAGIPTDLFSGGRTCQKCATEKGTVERSDELDDEGMVLVVCPRFARETLFKQQSTGCPTSTGCLTLQLVRKSAFTIRAVQLG